MKKKIGIIGSLVLCGLLFTSCGNKELSQVEKELDENLLVKFHYVAEDEFEDQDKIVFQFEDKDGVEFTYISELEGIEVNESELIKTQVERCSYGDSYMGHYADKIIWLCNESGLKFAYTNRDNAPTQLELTVASYEDLQIAADLVHRIIDTHKLPVIEDNSLFNMPEIVVYNNNQLNRSYELIGQEEETMDSNDIYDSLLFSYAGDCKGGLIENDLPADVAESVKPDRIDTVYVNMDKSVSVVEDWSFNYNLESENYEIWLYDLAEGNANVVFSENNSLGKLIEATGCQHNYANGYLSYDMNGKHYTCQLDEGNEVLQVYKDGKAFMDMPVKMYDQDTNHLIAVASLEELQEMFEMKGVLNIKDATITFK